MRLDKWLWAARFFKTRSLATKACELGRISSNGQSAKPSREVCVGDRLVVRNEGGEFGIEVLLLNEMRGPAAAAQSLYRESDESRVARAKAAEERKAAPRFDDFEGGRPSKRNRRKLDWIRGLRPMR
ncbi:MAG: RNA-binding S4 domain-containing protein [Bryobacteraceae bacterium]